MLGHLLQGNADRLVVVDTETTGVYPSDRVIEVAAITLTPSGQVVDRWETLIQPQRDVGPTHIHRISPSMLTHAPTFPDVAGDLADRLDGAVLVGHNVAFDVRLLAGEFNRINLELSTAAGAVCTLRLTGAKLAVACEQHQVDLSDAHRASADADATVRLLLAVANRASMPAGPARVNGQRPPHLQRVVTRDDITCPTETPTPPLIIYLADRLTHRGADPDLLPYLDVLGRALSDLHLDRDERVHLEALAQDLGLGQHHIAAAHRRFVNDLIDEALDDHVVTDEEYDQLLRVAAALDVDLEIVEARTTAARSAATSVRLEEGMRVVFTGNPNGWTRNELEGLARSWGLETARSVTKTTGLVAAADPASRSGKAKKAHGWGIPVIDVQRFIDAGPGSRIETSATSVVLRVVECPSCHTTTTEPAAKGGMIERWCESCADVQPRAPRTTPAPPTDRAPAAPVLETLSCQSCGFDWQRQRRPGRKPSYCPDCS
jgi:DNA polymerase-3 subunit epsilon